MAEEDSEQIRHDAALRSTVAELAGVRDDARLIALLEHDDGQRPYDASETYWVLDPVDGTKGFLRREQFAVCLALVERGRPVLAVLACPNWTVDGTLLVAERGRGTESLPLVGDSLHGRAVRVNGVADSTNIVVTQSVDSSTLNQDEMSAVLAQLGVQRPTLPLDSATKYAAVATGAAGLYLRLPNRADYFEKVWDHAAGVLVVEEAGGVVTDVNGAALDFTRGRTLAGNRGILASNGVLHQRALAAIVSSCLPPEAPTPPRDFECCGNGCAQCVYVLYDESAVKYRDDWARYRKRMLLRGIEVGDATLPEVTRGSVAAATAVSVNAFEEFERRMKAEADARK